MKTKQDQKRVEIQVVAQGELVTVTGGWSASWQGGNWNAWGSQKWGSKSWSQS
jgi:hypothetical protein